MKVLIYLVLILGFVCSAKAQADCITRNNVYVRDMKGNFIKNANLEVFEIDKNNRKTFAFNPHEIDKDAYVFISLLGWFKSNDEKNHTVAESYILRVSAPGFETVEQSIKFRNCGGQNFEIKLKKSSLIVLSGVVYDPEGSIVVGANVSAKNKENKIFQTKTNVDGIYTLELQPDIYEIEIESAGFKTHKWLNFNVVNSTYGKINQDIILELGACNDCELIVNQSKEVEKPK